jgi:hypothetical protein
VQPAPKPDLTLIDPQTNRRENYLASLPPNSQDLVRKIANYEVDPRTIGTRAGNRDRLIAAAAQYAPEYDQTAFPSRAKAVRDFATGPQGNAVRSFDVAIDHLDLLSNLAKAMSNGDYRAINAIRNRWQEETGTPAPTNFDAAKGIVGDEISKAIVGSKTALGDREETKAAFNTASSPAQLQGVIDTYKGLMAGQLKGIKKQYEDTTGLKNFDSRVRPSTRQALLADHRGDTPEPAPAPAPKLGSVPIPGDAVRDLRSNPTPQRRKQFDQIFGDGASNRLLGPQ